MNFKQTLFVQYYTEGDTKGNCEQSMISAGYKRGYARFNCGRFITANNGIQQAIDYRLKALENNKKNTIETVNADFEFAKLQCKNKEGKLIDRTNFIRICENQAKNADYYLADNQSKTEQAKLTEIQRVEADRIARILNLEDARKGKVG